MSLLTNISNKNICPLVDFLRGGIPVNYRSLFFPILNSIFGIFHRNKP